MADCSISGVLVAQPAPPPRVRAAGLPLASIEPAAPPGAAAACTAAASSPAASGTPEPTCHTQPQNAPPTDAPRLTDSGAFIMPNASLTEMIDLLAKRLKINYILDPAVRGTVSIFTYGEVKPVDYMPLLETILRVNGDAMVKVGDMYRIVPVNRINQLPIKPLVNADPKTLPDDERMIMNLIFLKYATASEIANLIKPFLGEGAFASTYEAANLLILEDNSRSMRRTMELIASVRQRPVRRPARAPVRSGEQPAQRFAEGSGSGLQGLRAFGKRLGGEIHPGGPHQHDHRGGSESRDFHAGGKLDRQAGYRGEVERGRGEQLRLPVEVRALGDGRDGDHGALQRESRWR